jgi:hypothetical protein
MERERGKVGWKAGTEALSPLPCMGERQVRKV